MPDIRKGLANFRRSFAAEQLQALRREQVPLLLPGMYPAIEMLGFALVEARDGCRTTAVSIWDLGREEEDDDDLDMEGLDFTYISQPGA